jgi:CheY-like chemotaxis protein
MRLGHAEGEQCVPKVLIAEDDLMIADLLEEILIEQGYDVCGIARTVADAVELCRQHNPDLAVIDVHLADGGLGTEIAAQLGGDSRLGILYATGNASLLIKSAAGGHACLAKPYRDSDLARSLEIIAEIVATGNATPPFPRGFTLLPAGTRLAGSSLRG